MSQETQAKIRAMLYELNQDINRCLRGKRPMDFVRVEYGPGLYSIAEKSKPVPQTLSPQAPMKSATT